MPFLASERPFHQTERSLLAQVTKLAEYLGWRTYQCGRMNAQSRAGVALTTRLQTPGGGPDAPSTYHTPARYRHALPVVWRHVSGDVLRESQGQGHLLRAPVLRRCQAGDATAVTVPRSQILGEGQQGRSNPTPLPRAWAVLGLDRVCRPRRLRTDQSRRESGVCRVCPHPLARVGWGDRPRRLRARSSLPASSVLSPQSPRTRLAQDQRTARRRSQRCASSRGRLRSRSRGER